MIVPISKVEIQQYICDNPACRRIFQPIGGVPQPGLSGSIVVQFYHGLPLHVGFWAHTFRCVGPAVKANYERLLAEESKDASS